MKSQIQKIIETIYEEAERIEYGKLIIEVTVAKKELTNMQIETKRSTKLDE